MKKLLFWAVINSLLIVGLPAKAANIWHVRTNGLPGNLGTSGSSWDLRTALNKTSVIGGGDTVYLHGGAYTNAPENYIPESSPGADDGFEGDIFMANISGAYGNPVTIMSFPGEWALIDGQAWGGFYSFHASTRPTLQAGSSSDVTKGRFLTWQNFEVMSSSTETRTSSTDDSIPPDLFRPDGFIVFGRSNILNNIVVHDLTTGFSAWEQSSGVILQDCLSYNNGWQGTPHAHGHGMYTQNLQARETKWIGTNIFANNSDNALQAYGTTATALWHYRFSRNMFINNRLLLGGKDDTSQGDFVTDGNFHYNSDLVFIYHPSVNAFDMTVKNNYIGGGGKLQGGSWKTAIVTNNTVINTAAGQVFDLLPLPPAPAAPTVPTNWVVNFNKYIMANTNLQAWNIEGLLAKRFTNWISSTGWDINSVDQAPLPSTNLIVLIPVTSNGNRAHVAAYNWAIAASVPVDLTALGWNSTDSVRVRNAQDYFVDITTNSIPGNIITLNMQAASHTVALPRGSPIVFGAKTFPTFGAFVIERIIGAAPTPTNAITITSTPTTGVTITATSDNSGNGNGTTTFVRNYLFGTPVTLVAPLTSGTNNFSQWKRAGVTFSSSNSVSFSIVTNETWTATYVAPPVITWTLNMSSMTPSNASLTNSPLDNSGLGNGVAPYSRTYNDGTVVTIDAPVLAGGNTFQRWNRNGVPLSTAHQVTFTANSATLGVNPSSFQAVFAPIAAATNLLVVTSSNPGSGVPIVVSLADVNGAQNGTTPFNRVYLTNDTVSLTAPLMAPNGNVWVGWVDAAGNLSTNTVNSFIMSTNRTRMATYTNAPLPDTLLGHASNRRRGVR